MFLSEWREFRSVLFLGGGGDLMTVRVSILLKSRSSLIYFRACFLPGGAKDLTAPRYNVLIRNLEVRENTEKLGVNGGIILKYVF